MNCSYCGAAIAKPRKSQLYCPAPRRCRQLAYRQRLSTHTHQCGCGKPHRVRKAAQRPRGVQRALLVEWIALLLPYARDIDPETWRYLRRMLRDEKERLS